jgi:hypothetical protein
VVAHHAPGAKSQQGGRELVVETWELIITVPYEAQSLEKQRPLCFSSKATP